jgi:aminopeptidase N
MCNLVDSLEIHDIMRKITLLVILTGFVFQVPTVLPAQLLSDAAKKLQRDIITGVPAYAFHTLNYRMSIDIYHCFSNPFPKSFNATLICSLKADSTLHSVKLNADTSSLWIDSVSLDGVSFSHANNFLNVDLDRYYDPGETFDIKIYYRHRDVDDGAFFAGNGMVFTNCEPERARNWFPCHDVPSDKATFDLTATTPVNVTLGSNGILIDSTIQGDTLYYHWVSANPLATYLAVIAAADNYILKILYWHKLSDPSDSIPIRFYYRPGEDPDPVANVILSLTDFYSQTFCEYPFQKVGFASLNELFSGGGMENQTLITLCSTCWRESLAAHEFAHMWVGDLVTCATWSDIWLNEGLATWTTVYWQEHNLGYESYKSFLINMYAKPYLANNPGYAISDSSWAKRTPSFDTLFNTYITYEKGACMVHQLRYVLGDSLFFSVLKAYVSDTTLRYKSATIGDLMRITNKVTGANYNWFFHDWVFQPNHPYYQNTYDLLQNGADSYTLRFLTKQTQIVPSFFRMILPLKIIFADSTDTLVRVMNTINNQLFSFTFGKQPVRLIFDPDTNIMLKEGSTSLGIIEIAGNAIPFILSQNVPNPAAKKTAIPYILQVPMHVRLEIFDISGKSISVPFNEYKPAGRFIFTLDCSGLRPGTYFYRMTAGKYEATKKMVIMPSKY